MSKSQCGFQSKSQEELESKCRCGSSQNSEIDVAVAVETWRRRHGTVPRLPVRPVVEVVTAAAWAGRNVVGRQVPRLGTAEHTGSAGSPVGRRDATGAVTAIPPSRADLLSRADRRGRRTARPPEGAIVRRGRTISRPAGHPPR